ncbi:SEC-C metal-binding domain-containing protein [Nocardia sp. NPDC005746]|uniref:SEC-C metal-binding domain-containing protein n=1 Tax=Nocardia sp. NPDC005746 TaxID=3157062 RepID=UPI0033D4220E
MKRRHLNEAASYWALAGDFEQARRRYLDAIADGGEVAGDARVWYAVLLLGHGDTQEARNLLDVVFAEGPDDYLVYEAAGEAFEGRGDWAEALRWFDAGLERSRISAGDDARETLGRYRLGSGRARVRQQLGWPEDHIDLGVDRERHRWLAMLERLGRPERDLPARAAILCFPEDEFAQVIRRWPALHEYYGTFDEHRRTVEHALRSADHGMPAAIVAGTADGLAEYAADPENPSTRAAFAAHLAGSGAAITWPPGRNEPCWCGSGRKYKKCCGRPG